MTRWSGVLLLVWLVGFTAGCLVLIALLVHAFHWLLLLFAIPLLAGWVIAAGLTVYLLFGSHRLILSADHLNHQWQALIPLYRRQIPIEHVGQARYNSADATSSKSLLARRGSIHIATVDGPIRFAQGISSEEGQWIAQLVNQCLESLAPDRIAKRWLDDKEQMEEGGSSDSPPSASDPFLEAVLPSPSPFAQPIDSRWQHGNQRGATTFTQRGQWLPFLIGSTTLINLFWNGIVAVFIMVLIHNFQWPLALFLVPFVAIGLLIFVAWVFALLAPCQSRSYEFRLGGMVYFSNFLGIKQVEEHQFGELERIAITRQQDDVEESADLEGLESMPSRFTLCLIDDQQTTVAKVAGLALGEARWMADTLWREQPNMFSRRARRTG